MRDSKRYNMLQYIAILGNVIYILWVLYNGIDEGFRNIGSVQSIALLGLIVLLILNITIIYHLRKSKNS